eukprot:11176737-Lingulodinium_polyedra.AAC.1
MAGAACCAVSARRIPAPRTDARSPAGRARPCVTAVSTHGCPGSSPSHQAVRGEGEEEVRLKGGRED